MPLLQLPENETQRLLKLHTYGILDTVPENTFDKIAALAAQIFDTPIAQVTFVDSERVFFKSNISPLEATEIPRADSFCTYAILNEKPTTFENTLEVPSLLENPFVTMDNGVRFYAGAPLRTIEGLNLGTLCVLDVKPRTVTAQQIKMLETLSSIVMDELELRLATRKALRTQTDMLNRVVHDMKNPNMTISLSAELLKKKADNPKIVADFADRIKNAANNVLNGLNKMLDLSQIENLEFKLSVDEIDILKTLERTKQNFDLIASQKNQKVNIICNCDTSILGDDIRLQEAFDNLLSNALKYAPINTEVLIKISNNEKELVVEFKDQGQGLTEEDLNKLFMKFAKLSAIPTGREYSNGIGLSIVKMLIEQHKGQVWATSEGKNKGASFFVSLPIN
ncbi:GAF domain-containing sensor histidine kinase [Pedobacter namyangjuensis]|uniref:GAF domain-containing sensor histidine kinase n=1 Tax=Pedobacter namyangjuensis TaxID=600626 RepID=UPI000DE331A2|nr:GAF domain-containing sensor histidine kinase [Pedobacter namyangjuensis]